MILSDALIAHQAQRPGRMRRRKSRRPAPFHGLTDERGDWGPALLHAAIRDRVTGAVIREPVLELTDGAEPDQPNRTVRRARRTDPLEVLLRNGTINTTQWQAGERFRGELEMSEAGVVPRYDDACVSTYPSDRVSVRVLMACTAVRKAREVLAPSAIRLSVTLWVAVGGSLRGYQTWTGVGRATATEALGEALDMLARHYGI